MCAATHTIFCLIWFSIIEFLMNSFLQSDVYHWIDIIQKGFFSKQSHLPLQRFNVFQAQGLMLG